METSKYDSIYELARADALQMVIELIPLHLRWNLALASKDLYELVCDMEKFKYKMKLDTAKVS